MYYVQFFQNRKYNKFAPYLFFFFFFFLSYSRLLVYHGENSVILMISFPVNQ